VVFQFDTSDRSWRRRFWLTRDYLPQVAIRACHTGPLASLIRVSFRAGISLRSVSSAYQGIAEPPPY
jgi:hypothetical protein